MTRRHNSASDDHQIDDLDPAIAAEAEAAREQPIAAIRQKIKEGSNRRSAFGEFEFLPRWVAWRNEMRDGKTTKVPYSPSGGPAKADDPLTWGTRSAAAARAETIIKRHGGGVGINLGDLGDGTALGGIDLDSCRREDGTIEPWALDIIQRFASYTEISPSGTGAKIFFGYSSASLSALRKVMGNAKHGKQFKRRTGEDHPPAIELYLSSRYFAVTEQRLEDTPNEIMLVNTELLLDLIQTIGPAFAGTTKTTPKADDEAEGKASAKNRSQDGSRSGAARRIGFRVYRIGANFEEFCAAVRDDPETAGWFHEKGITHNYRELKRIWEKVSSSSGKPWEVNLKAPYDTARLFIRAQFDFDGLSTLHHHRGVFYWWNGSAYRETSDREIRSRAYRFLDQCVGWVKNSQTKEFELKSIKPNTYHVNQLVDSLRAATLLPDVTAAPVWLDEDIWPVDDNLDPGDIIACANGLLHLPTMSLLPHTPAFYTHNALDYPFEPDAPARGMWLAFLRQLWPDDTEAIATLQEAFGHMLTPDTSQQKIILLVGAPRSGKGTIARVLRKLIGDQNVAAPTLTGLSKDFGLEPLIGRLIGIIPDARLSGRADPATISERLLSITGEDAIDIDRKHRAAWTGQLLARFWILTNELPKLGDASGALASRFIVLVLTISFLGREDPGLTNKLFTELPGILNWAIEGWHRLRQRGHFIQPASGTETREDLEALGSPVGAFVHDCCEFGADYKVTRDALFDAWEEWCKMERRLHPGDKATFGRNLRAAFPGLKRGQAHNGERYHIGIRLKAVRTWTETAEDWSDDAL